MAKSKKSKSQIVRDWIAANPDHDLSDNATIVKALKSKGVTASNVSSVIAKLRAQKKPGGSAPTVRATNGQAAKRRSSRRPSKPVDPVIVELSAAKDYLDQFDTPDDARASLERAVAVDSWYA